jgi:hypothetical protein
MVSIKALAPDSERKSIALFLSRFHIRLLPSKKESQPFLEKMPYLKSLEDSFCMREDRVKRESVN